MQAQRLQSQSLNVTRFCGCRRCSRSQVLQLRRPKWSIDFKRCGDGGLLIALTRQPGGGFLLTVAVAKLHRFCWKPQASSLRCPHICNSASATLAKFKQVVLQISILVIVPVKPAEFRSQ